MDVALQNVRLSFPSLFEPTSFADQDKKKFQANFLMTEEEHGDLLKKLKTAAKKLAVEKFGDKAGGIPNKNIFLKNGAEKDYDGYGEGTWFISAKSNRRPVVVDKDRTPLAAEDGKPYAGCFVNAMIELSAYSNDYGKFVSASLSGVQFFRDGEPFGSGAKDADEMFTDLSTETKKDVASEGSDDDAFFKD